MQARKQFHFVAGALALVLGVILSLPAMATHQSRTVGNFSAEDAQTIEQIVRDYILNHPEIISKVLPKGVAGPPPPPAPAAVAAARPSDMSRAIKPVSAEDHIRGSADALVKIVEFSDFECPFCKRVHPTLKQIMSEYGASGKVAWVYRHFPLDALHKKARKEAQASECANELGGNDAFWAFTDRLFEITPANDRFDLAKLPDIAEFIGLDRAKFEVCIQGDMRGGKYAAHIEADYQDATASGGRGTPYMVVIAPNGDTFPISGARPFSSIKSVIETALARGRALTRK